MISDIKRVYKTVRMADKHPEKSVSDVMAEELEEEGRSFQEAIPKVLLPHARYCGSEKVVSKKFQDFTFLVSGVLGAWVYHYTGSFWMVVLFFITTHLIGFISSYMGGDR